MRDSLETQERGLPLRILHREPRDVRYERRREPTRTEIIDREKEAIAERLIRVCHELPRHEFEALVARMAEIEIKYRLRRAMHHPSLTEDSAPAGGRE
jgi:hypothetical protein